jgi:hypothetical protein
MLSKIPLHLFANQILFNTAASGFTFAFIGCANPPGFDSCWNKASADAISIFKAHYKNGTCTDVDYCFTPTRPTPKLQSVLLTRHGSAVSSTTAGAE